MQTQLVQLAASKSGSSGGSYVFLLIIVVVLVFFFTASRRRQRASTQTQGSIRPGSEVMTTAGLYGTVTGIDDEGLILLEVSPGVVLRFARGAVSKVISSGPAEEALDGEDEDAYDEDAYDEADETAATDEHEDESKRDGGSPPKSL